MIDMIIKLHGFTFYGHNLDTSYLIDYIPRTLKQDNNYMYDVVIEEKVVNISDINWTLIKTFFAFNIWIVDQGSMGVWYLRLNQTISWKTSLWVVYLKRLVKQCVWNILAKMISLLITFL